MNPLMLVGVIVGSTVAADLLQSLEMKRQGEIDDFHPRGIGRLLTTLARQRYLILAVFFMALSFFAFMAVVSKEDLSFVVPATAATYVVETVLAKLVLKERIDKFRWTGALLVACGVYLLIEA